MSIVARQRMALVVHPDLTMLSKYQALLAGAQFSTVVARDMPTALLAITQHYFEVAIISSQLGESGDGWPLAGVFHLVFPKSFVSVIVPGADLLNLQTAINNGVQEIFEEDRAPETVVSEILAAAARGAGATPRNDLDCNKARPGTLLSEQPAYLARHLTLAQLPLLSYSGGSRDSVCL